MNSSLSMSFTVRQKPERVFAAIADVRGWWSGNVEGDTDALGSEFTYTVPDIHFCRFRIIERVASRRVAWHVLDSYLSFTTEKQEWTGTTVVFEISERDEQTQLRFTHEGLRPDHECYTVCENAWTEYICGSLRNLIENGDGRPNSFEGDDALESARAARKSR